MILDTQMDWQEFTCTASVCLKPEIPLLNHSSSLSALEQHDDAYCKRKEKQMKGHERTSGRRWAGVKAGRFQGVSPRVRHVLEILASSTVAQKGHTNSGDAKGHCCTLCINQLSRGLQECLALKTTMRTETSEVREKLVDGNARVNRRSKCKNHGRR